jgi:hypothetical protein
MDSKGLASAAQMKTKNIFVKEFVSAYSKVIVEKECHLLLVSKQIYLPDFSGNWPYFLQKPEKSCLVLLDSSRTHASKGAKMTQELCPPNPKELLIAAVTLCAFFSFAHVSIPSTMGSKSF